MDTDPSPAVRPSIPAPVKKKAPRPVKEGTRFSARLRGRAAAPVLDRRARVSDDLPEDPAEDESTPTGDAPPANPAASKKATVDDYEESEDDSSTDDEGPEHFVVSGGDRGGEPFAPSADDERGEQLVPRFYLREDQYGHKSIAMGLFPRNALPS